MLADPQSNWEGSSLFVKLRDCLCPAYISNGESDFIAWLQCIEQQTVLRLELLGRAAAANGAALCLLDSDCALLLVDLGHRSGQVLLSQRRRTQESDSDARPNGMG